MAANHYATLGVAPHSPREVIRAAYLRLMRRYHPDKNPSPEAAARVRAINAAYSVLSVAEERAKYDALQHSRRAVPRPAPAAEWPVPRRAAGPSLIAAGAAFLAWVAERARPRRAARPALIAGGAATLALVAYLVPAWVVPETKIERSSVGGKATAAASVSLPKSFAAAAPGDASLCSSEAAAQSITQEIFRRAARVPGSNGAALERIAASSLVRFASPAIRYGAGDGAVIGCRARVVLYLPPGVTAPGGRQSVDGIVAYSLRGAASGGTATLSLTAEPAFAKALAFITGASPDDPPDLQLLTVPEPPPKVVLPEIAPTPQVVSTPAPPPVPVAKVRRPQPEPRIVQQKPSFSCSGQRSWAEKTVCTSESLAALDRAMSSLWGDAMERANDRQRASLLASDRRFLASRAQCASEACVRSAYLVATDDIRSIMYVTPPR